LGKRYADRRGRHIIGRVDRDRLFRPNIIRIKFDDTSMDTFTHKTLGTFKQREYIDELRWETELELPAFAAFKYSANGKVRRSRKVPVAIYCDEPPPKVALKMLATMKASQKKLVKNICDAFFRDLHQQGYDDLPGPDDGYGMWWSRDPVTVALSCREVLEKRLKQDRIWQPEDLFALLYEPSIEIYPSMPDVDGVVRTLIDMGAEFEDEHGVSVLTDGKKVLNLGYAGEA